ncbi:MAG: hypothetical protein ACI399_00115 [Candidatus Cryptobacteroides sp.]
MKNLFSIAVVLALCLSAAFPALSSGQENALRQGGTVNMTGSFLEPLQKRDSALIADQFRYGFHLKDVEAGTLFMLPDLSGGLMDSVDVVSPWLVDTVKVYGRRKSPSAYDIDVSLILTSFEEGRRDLVPLAVARTCPDGLTDTLLFEPQSVEFFTMPVDTATYKIHDIKGQIKYPLTLAELLPYAALVWGIALVAIILWILLSRKKAEAADVAYKDPPYVVALRKLDRFRSNKYWAPEKQKAFYSGITEALKEYIAARYGFDAMEMTTAEIFGKLRHSDVPADLYGDVKTLFETADFVKFAKASASDEENAAALPVAVRFVTTTYQSQLAEEEARAAASGRDNAKGGGE